jgi:hypothetical protein
MQKFPDLVFEKIGPASALDFAQHMKEVEMVHKSFNKQRTLWRIQQSLHHTLVNYQ